MKAKLIKESLNERIKGQEKQLEPGDEEMILDFIEDTRSFEPNDMTYQQRVDKLESYVPDKMCSFITYYKRLTGATDWDLPDEIYKYGRD